MGFARGGRASADAADFGRGRREWGIAAHEGPFIAWEASARSILVDIDH